MFILEVITILFYISILAIFTVRILSADNFNTSQYHVLLLSANNFFIS